MMTRLAILATTLLLGAPVFASVSGEEPLAPPISLATFLSQAAPDSYGEDASNPFPKGTFEIGLMTGAVGFNTALADGAEPGTIFSLSPGIGYFLAPQVEMVATFDIATYYGRYKFVNDMVGFTVGFRYHLALDGPTVPGLNQPIILYFGASMGFDFYLANDVSPSREVFVMDIPFGLLVQVIKGVFLDVGMQASLNEPVNQGWNTTGSFTFFRVGVRIFV